MKLNKIIHYIEETYPTALACSWDNVGLMVGDINQEIKKIYTVIEVNDAVLADAIEKKVDLIITHHPLLCFTKLDRVTNATYKGKLVYQLIQNNIAVYSMHTNFDIAFDGMNDYFTKLLGFAPTECFELSEAPTDYMEKHNGKAPGLGRICTLPDEMTLNELCTYVKNKLNMSYLQFVGNKDAIIRKVAIITGAGADYYEQAKEAGADVLISGDLKYHLAQDILDSKMNVIDCGHYGTEYVFRDAIAEFLTDLPDITIIRSSLNLNPIQVI